MGLAGCWVETLLQADASSSATATGTRTLFSLLKLGTRARSCRPPAVAARRPSPVSGIYQRSKRAVRSSKRLPVLHAEDQRHVRACGGGEDVQLRPIWRHAHENALALAARKDADLQNEFSRPFITIEIAQIQNACGGRKGRLRNEPTPSPPPASLRVGVIRATGIRRDIQR